MDSTKKETAENEQPRAHNAISPIGARGSPVTPDIRLATKDDDMNSIVALINEAYLWGETGIIVKPFDRVLIEEVVTLIELSQLLLLLDASSKMLLGCVKVQVLPNAIGEWGCLAVAQSQRQSGYGKILVSAAENHLVQMGCTTLQLELLAPSTFRHEHKERLRRWYTERLGYKLKVADDYTGSTVSLSEGTLLLSRFVLQTDADFTTYQRTV